MLVNEMTDKQTEKYTDDQMACPMDTPIVPPSWRTKMKDAVLVARSFRGIAACNAMSGIWNRHPVPKAATSGKRALSALRRYLVREVIHTNV